MAIGTGLIVANLYYIQPLMGEIARGFSVPEAMIGYAVTLCQAGLALGTLTILPLGDVTDRRRLITLSCLLSAASLVVMALSPNPWIFLAANLALGITSIATHLQVSYAAHLADPARRGRAVGAVMSGLLIGILVARTISGYAGMWVSWRTVLLAAAGATLLLGLVLRLRLPRDNENHTMHYFDLLGSMPRLFLNQSTLRDCCIFGALTFAAFNAFWATLTFHLEGAPFHMTTQGIGLFSLVAVAGALAANGTGRLASHVHPMKIIAGSLVLTIASFGIFYAGGFTIIGMAFGIILMDLGIQATHISNQTLIHALMPQARNRIHCVYMVCYFVGGSAGSGVGTWSFAHLGWAGLCLAGGGFTAAALVFWLLRRGGRISEMKIAGSEPPPPADL
jgi:predicted MFS family arabinose efflux permease